MFEMPQAVHTEGSRHARRFPQAAATWTIWFVVAVVLGGCSSDVTLNAEPSASPTTSASSANPQPGPSRPTARVHENLADVHDVMDNPRVRPDLVTVNGHGDLLVHWTIGGFMCGKPFVLTWAPHTGHPVHRWYMPDSTGFEATANGFVAGASRCRGNGRKASPVWLIGPKGNLAAAQFRTRGSADRNGHLHLPCQLKLPLECEVDPRTNSMWPAERQSHWFEPWDDRTGVLRRFVASATENDWSDDNGATWHSIPEMWDVDVVRFDERVALVNRRAAGPVNEVNTDGSTSPHGLVGGGNANRIEWAVTPDGRLFGTGNRDIFLLSDPSWRQLTRYRLPQGFSNAHLVGRTVYAYNETHVVISRDLAGHFDPPVDLNTLVPTS